MAPSQSSAQPELVGSKSVMSRYTDAYRTANFQTKLGSVIKAVSIGIGLVIFVSVMIVLPAAPVPPGTPGFVNPSAEQNPFGITLTNSGIESIRIGGMLAGAVVAFVVAAIGFIWGVLVSSQGQMVKAALDAAVNTSPFLTHNDRAKVMSL